MRLGSLIVLPAVVGLASETAAGQAGRSTAPAAANRACSLLTSQLVTQVTAYDKKALDLVMRVPPNGSALGANGSECTYGGITLQVDPFTAAYFEKQRNKTWVPVPGVGEAAYFRDNRGEWAELYVRAGTHVMTIQMDVPMGRTAASIQPNVINLAKTLLPQLK
ncbi:MAG: hypothetical protein IT184_15550 [Acidobacteria bacterium]|nr:hypothetical protein [Acidobacteriota bacterium]